MIRSVRMNKLATVLPSFQRFSFAEFSLKVLVTLSPKVDSEGIGVVDPSLGCSKSLGVLV